MKDRRCRGNATPETLQEAGMAAQTESFRQQHAEIMDMVRRIEPNLVPGKLAAGAAEMRSLVASLTGKLTIHLAMEDKALYPSLLKHADAGVRETAQKFIDEMSGIKPQIQKFSSTWTEQAIRADSARFCAEMRQVFAALGDRIQREDGQLYALVDRLG
jgi:iron-sulfur cluster repair protein YtfE (RIC family)